MWEQFGAVVNILQGAIIHSSDISAFIAPIALIMRATKDRSGIVGGMVGDTVIAVNRIEPAFSSNNMPLAVHFISSVCTKLSW